VISRIEDCEIVEDWAASDNLDLIRQLGPSRAAAGHRLAAKQTRVTA
jgi:hypothetical protein